MTNYTMYKIFNLTEFNATGLTSRTYTQVLSGIGKKDVLVTKGNLVGLTYDNGSGDVYLPLNLESQNPFVMDGVAAYVDANNDVYLGFPA